MNLSQDLQIGSRVKIGNLRARENFYYPVVGLVGTLIAFSQNQYGYPIGEVVIDGENPDARGWHIQLVDLIRFESENNLDSKDFLKKEVEL